MKLPRSRHGSKKIAEHYGPLVLIIVAVMLLVVAACSKKEESPPVVQRQGWVTDYAGILSPEDKSRISDELAAYEKESCHQIFLLIVPSLDGEKMVAFSQRTAKAWGIGQPGLDNGFLLTIAMQEGTIRIETGSYFEWFIQNGTAAQILQEVMIPLFKEDKFVEGVKRGLEEIMAAGRLKPIPADQKPDICRQ